MPGARHARKPERHSELFLNWIKVSVFATFTVVGCTNTHGLIHLRSGTVSPQNPVLSSVHRRGLLSDRPVPQAHPSWGPLGAARHQFLVALVPPTSHAKIAEVHEQLARNGGWVSSYLPDDALLCIGKPSSADLLRSLPQVAWVEDYVPSGKIAPEWSEWVSAHDKGDVQADLLGHQLHYRRPGEPFLGSILVSDKENGSHRVVVDVHFPRLHKAWMPSEGKAGLHNEAALSAYAPGWAARDEWESVLRREFGGGIRLWHATKNVVSYAISSGFLADALSWFAEQPSVHWLAPHSTKRLHNWEGSAICQSAEAPPDAPFPLTGADESHPFWSVGLTGSGQVVGGGDSGVDFQNCFFRDRAVEWGSNLTTNLQSGVMSINSTVHRKIRLYRALADAKDNNGHGTHTMGTLCGMPDDASNMLANNYRGLAPDAKLAFTDLGGGGSNGIFTPQDLSDSYYRYPYDVGARVHSDSWGSSTVEYDFMASEVDSFTWDHQDFLPVFAAGNEGMGSMSPTGGLTTVTSPATAKNCIAVGASRSAGRDGADRGKYAIYSMSVSQVVAGGSQEVDSYRVMQASFGGKVSSLFDRQLSPSVASPIDGCTSLQNQADVSGTVVIMARGNCYFSIKVANAQAANAVAVLVYDNQINDFFVPATDNANPVTIPAMAIPRLVGQLLSSATQAGGKLTLSFKDAVPPKDPWDSLADFSSKGPTTDQRIKPDLVAPGTLQSAYSNPRGNTCDLRYMQGTSMATPVVAGSAVLVRQYFEQGFYPTGAPVAANAFKPGGALVKAVLIGGAAGLTGFESDTGLPLAPPPSFRQGFGRVLLSQSLPLQKSARGWSLQLVDRANLSTGESHQYCVRSTGGPLTVTLAWHDYPASMSAAKALVNDLDLSIRAAGLNGFPLLGNGGGMGSINEADRTNNVEQVAVSYLPAGEISIEVKGFRVAVGPQPYALVVIGAFTGVLASPANPVNGAAQGSSNGTCQIVVAVITEGPVGLTNRTSIAFSFQTQSGKGSGVQFECALTDGLANSTSNYTACNSPMTYSDLSDGGYHFYVRAQGESIADSRAFFKDTTPPRVTFSSPSLLGSKSAADIATFAFSGEDASDILYWCKLSADSVDNLQTRALAFTQNGTVADTPVTFGEWLRCNSPVSYHWLLPGQWTYSTRAQDAAGNAADISLQHNWTVSFEPGNTYVRIQNGTFGPTAQKSATFHMQAFDALPDGITANNSASYECRIVPMDAAAAEDFYNASYIVPPVLSSSELWSRCTSPMTYDNLPDGSYAFNARAVGTSEQPEETQAASVFTVDSSPPTVQLDDTPAPIVNSSSIQLGFSSSKTPATFFCSLSSQGNDTMPFVASPLCSSPLQLSLTDGTYIFGVTATDKVGNKATPVNVTFIVDTTPPSFTNITYPFATSANNITITFNATDGPGGSSLAGVQCRLRAQKLEDDTLKGTAVGDWTNCSSPVVFGGLEEGKWGLQLRAQDRANNSRETSEMEVYIDKTPPNATVLAGPTPSQPSPSKVSLSFSGQSGGAIGAPVNNFQCLLAEGNQGVGNATINKTVNNPLAVLKSVAVLSVGSWANCSSPATYENLKSGNYTFQIVPIDAAGNIGATSTPYAFGVDASLPLDGGSGSQSALSGWKLWAVIAGGVGLGILSLLIISLCCNAHRQRQRAYPALPPHMHGHYLQDGVGQGAHPPLYQPPQQDAAVAAAIRASLAESQRETRREEERVRQAMLASAEEERLRQAIELSLREQQGYHAPEQLAPGPRDSSEEGLLAAIAASLAEEDVRRTLQASVHTAARPTAPALDLLPPHR